MIRFCLLLLCGLFLAATAQAKAFDAALFAGLPVQHEGRIKPLDSFARAQLQTLSGRDHIENLSAAAWMIEVLFDPARAMQRPVILVRNPDLLSLLQVARVQGGLYSYDTLAPALQAKQAVLQTVLEQPQETLTEAQKELVFLHRKLTDFDAALNSLSLFLPLSIALPEERPDFIMLPADRPLTYMDALKFRERLETSVKDIMTRKGDDIATYTDSERQLLQLSYTIAQLGLSGKNATLLRVLPDANPQGIWLTPWETVGGASGIASKDLFAKWQTLATAYHRPDAALWNKTVAEIASGVEVKAAPSLRPFALKVEVFYNLLHPYLICFALAAMALAGLLASRYTRLSVGSKIAFYALSLAGLINAAAICMRVYILERPPVGTLYESILFVALIVIIYSVIMALRRKQDLYLWVGSIAALFLYQLSFAHAADGDSFLKLGAVLNTNFWLATHVLCITTGYAFCILASVLAHVWLLRTDLREGLFQTVHHVALIALLCSALGTVLGGIWADQSWGRFWGWDPKENGALLICLWLVWVLHGRISGRMSKFALMLGLASLSIVVGLSWFGVNLLSVGLHSYGFTDRAALSLAGLVIGEGLFLSWVTYRHMRSVP